MSDAVGEMSETGYQRSEVSGLMQQRIEHKESGSHDPILATGSLQTATRVALLTGGSDKPYAIGLALGLSAADVDIEFIGSDELAVTELLNNPRIKFLNLRGSQNEDAGTLTKICRVMIYYLKLIAFAATTPTRVFHILWNNKFRLIDRVLLMLFYKMCSKAVLLTVHNVNAGKRDLNDSWCNRISLKIQYHLSNHLFVHTERMKEELIADFRVAARNITIIPFGVNTTVPNTSLSTSEAKKRLGLGDGDRVMLFFGNIAPYKGLEYLIRALDRLLIEDRSLRLLIAGRPKGPAAYWNGIFELLQSKDIRDHVIVHARFILDEETELYFKAADVLVLPYVRVFQSGVLFLGYGFGLPAIVADVATLGTEVVEGVTGCVFKPRDSEDLANVIRKYFQSPMFADLANQRAKVINYAKRNYSWNEVASRTRAVYSNFN